MSAKNIVTGLARVVIKIAIAAIVVFLIYRYAIKSYNFGKNIFGATAMEEGEGRDITVAIVEGKTVKEIGKILEDKGLIEDATLFYFQELVSGEHGKLKAGIYTLNTGMTPKDIIRVLAAGNEDSQYTDDSYDWEGNSPIDYDATDEDTEGVVYDIYGEGTEE